MLHSLHVVRAIALLLAVAGPAFAQQDSEDARGWTFYGRFQGTSNGSGLIMKLDPSVGYAFNDRFQAYAGLPVYFARESSGSASGIGNAYVGGVLTVLNPAIDYVSRLEITAPTGDESRGFSTGIVTVDWNNTFSRTFESLTPFVSVGIANTVSDTSFFVRPFSSDGLVGHFDGGLLYDVNPAFGLGASAYAVRASGEQRIVSRVIQQERTVARVQGRNFERQADVVGVAELANDHGFSAWIDFSPQSNISFQAGYNRSVAYELDSLFWGVSFRVGK